jgi:hypothetical protein
MESRRMKWAEHVAHMAELKNAYKSLIGNPYVKGPLGRPSRTWEDNIQMDLKEMGFVGVYGVHLSEDGASCCENRNESLGSMIGGEFLD